MEYVVTLWIWSVAALAIALLAIGVAYHKLSAAIQTARHESRHHAENVIRQIEGLLAVHAVVQPTSALPKSRGWAASPDMLQVLLLTAEERRPERVLECSSGFSTLVLAAWMRRTGHGHVWSLEHEPVYADKTRALLRTHGLADWATVLDAPLIPVTLPQWAGRWYDHRVLDAALPAGASVDMLVIDGPPDHLGPLARYPALPLLGARLAPTCTVVLDDTGRSSEQRALERWQQEMPGFSSVIGIDCEKGCTVLHRQA